MAAKAAHWMLYFVLIAMPITGWFGFGIPTFKYFGTFELPSFLGTGFFDLPFIANSGQTFDVWEPPLDYFHKNIMGRWVLWILILVHVSAALYHHFVQRDNTLRKMVPGMKPKI